MVDICKVTCRLIHMKEIPLVCLEVLRRRRKTQRDVQVACNNQHRPEKMQLPNDKNHQTVSERRVVSFHNDRVKSCPGFFV